MPPPSRGNDLTNAQWALLEPMLPKPSPTAVPAPTSAVSSTPSPTSSSAAAPGTSSRAISHRFPLSHGFFRAWRTDGTLDDEAFAQRTWLKRLNVNGRFAGPDFVAHVVARIYNALMPQVECVFARVRHNDASSSLFGIKAYFEVVGLNSRAIF